VNRVVHPRRGTACRGTSAEFHWEPNKNRSGAVPSRLESDAEPLSSHDHLSNKTHRVAFAERLCSTTKELKLLWDG
jgi:hypothetical protein